jgi:DNA-binding transcriptional LysR family regulator
LELRDLEYFARIAALGNVRRAADELDMSPAALSKCLRRLERDMKAQLVERTPKGVALTLVGRALLVQVERIRLTMQDVAREAEDLSHGNAGHLRIGTSSNRIEETHSVYAALIKEAPRVTIAITVSDNDALVPALQKGELDFIVNFLTLMPSEGCVQEALYDDEYVVCVSASHPLARRRVVTMEDLARERWTISPVQMFPWHPLYEAFVKRGLAQPTVAASTRSLRMRLLIVASTHLLGFMSRRFIQQKASLHRLKILPVRELTIRQSVGLIYRESGYLSPAALRFMGILRAAAKNGALQVD